MEVTKFSFSDVALTNDSGIKTISTNSLVAKVKSWNNRNCPGWMLSMATADEPPCKFSVGECWAELLKRSEANTSSAVRSQLENVAKNNAIRFCASGDVKIVRPDGKEMTMVEKQGFFLKSAFVSSPIVLIEVAIESVLDVIKGNIKKTNEKNLTVEYVDEEKCKVVKAPYMNFQSKFFSTSMQRVYLYKEMEAGVRTELLKDFDKYAASIYKTDVITPVSYDVNTKSVKIEIVAPKIATWSKFYSYLQACRAYRGADGCVQAQSSVGYYIGCVGDQYYRMYVTVSNICRLGYRFKTTCLELTELKGELTLAVVKSLVAAGWSIRIIYDSTKEISKKNDEKGVFRHVPFTGPYLKYFSLNDTAPVMNASVYTPSVGIDKWKDAVRLVADKAILFSTIYCHDALFSEFRFYLEPSSSAHSGQVMICSHKTEELDSLAYLRRSVSANVYKNFFIYTRDLFFLKDPFRVKFDVLITPSKYSPLALDDDDYEVFPIRNNPFEFSVDDVNKALLLMAENKIEEKRAMGKVVSKEDQVSQLQMTELQASFEPMVKDTSGEGDLLSDHLKKLAELEAAGGNEDNDFY